MSARADMLGRAGEYALGTLDEAERLAVERDMATDAELRAAVDRISAQLTALHGHGTQTEPASDAVWRRVETRIAETAQEAMWPAASDTHIVSLAERRETRTAAIRPGARRLWPGAAFAASLLAALGLGYLAGNFTATQREPTVIVLLQTPQNTPGAIFEAFADNSVRIVPLEQFTVPEGQIMQVWTLYDAAVGPVSLGTLAQARTTLLAGGQPFPTPAADQLYEITLEPVPGSPTGKPTGPILVKGFATRPAGLDPI